MNYKWCVVPGCKNTSIKTPLKLFVCVPKDAKTRHKWLRLANRNIAEISVNSVIYFCEEHFDLEKDMENYLKYKMGYSQKMVMTKGAVPSKFECQQDLTNSFCDTSTSRTELPEQFIEDCEDDQHSAIVQNVMSTESSQSPDESTLTESADRQHSNIPSYTYAYKMNPNHCDIEPPAIDINNIKMEVSFIKEEADNCEVSSFTEADTPRDTICTTLGSPSNVSDTGSVTDSNEDAEEIQCLQHTLKLIIKKPMLYIGVTEKCYFIVNLIHNHTNIPHEHILLCLKKIRSNSNFSMLEDDFGLPLDAIKIFLENIPLIAWALRPFILNYDDCNIKCLPLSMRHKYKVDCIIYCLEIDIQKPNRTKFQVKTWSEVRKSYTIKYLISFTPNGLVYYVSPGFGGSTTDDSILKICNFLDHLDPGNTIMAYNGFTYAERILDGIDIKLLRPPRIELRNKLSKSEKRLRKIDDSLRIHIERVIGRVSEFYMLQPHSIVSKNLLGVMDSVIVAACALTNLQDSIV